MLLSLLSLFAAIATQPPPQPDLRGLCDNVVTRSRAAPETGYRFEYERIILQAAGVAASDQGDPVALQRVRDLWSENIRAFNCRATNFEVINGNVLKYAVVSGSYHIINLAAFRWQLDLNLIGDHNNLTIHTNQTLLDFVMYRALATEGGSSYTELEELFWSLRNRAGAKFGCEVPGGATMNRIVASRSNSTNPILLTYKQACEIS